MEHEPDVRLIGYARVSTDDQDLTLQRAALMRFGVPRHAIYEEHASGGKMERKQLARALRPLHPGDTFVVWKLDRLGRTLTGVLEVLEKIKEQGVHFVSLSEQFDTSTPMGNAMLQVALVFAELERKMISERTKAGMAARKAAGAKFGRAHTIRDNPKRLARARALDAKGKLRDETGELVMSAAALMEILNAADRASEQIKNPETVRRWKRDGFPGLAAAAEATVDVPLDEIDDGERDWCQ